MKKIEFFVVFKVCILLLIFATAACTPVCTANRVSCFGYQKPFDLKGSVVVPLCEDLFMTCKYCYDYTEIANICNKEVRGCSGRCMVFGVWGSCYSKDERISCRPLKPAKDIKPEPEPEKKSATVAGTIQDTAVEKKPEPQKESEPEKKPEPAANKKPEPAADTKPEPEPDTKPEPTTNTNPEAPKDTKSEPLKNQE